MSSPRTHALFVNSGLLGQRTFARFVREWFLAGDGAIDATQTVLTDDLTVGDRVRRRLICTRAWPDGLLGLRNLDLFRWRAELHAGLLARRRIEGLERRGRRFDVLHFHRLGTAYGSVGRMWNTPSIVSIDATQRPVIESARFAAERLTYRPNIRRDGLVFRAARLIVATSAWARDSVHDEHPECRTEIAVMPSPVDLRAFDAAWPAERHERARRPRYRPRVLFIGGDFARKGGYDLLDAWERGRIWERADLDVVTAWPVEQRRTPPHVRYHKHVEAYSDAWRALWRDADLFVMPTRDEAFGAVFQEAGAAGLPAIGTRLNAIPEIVRDGETGLLVPRSDPDALVGAIASLLSSPDRSRSMGERARRHIAATANAGEYRDRLAEAIERLARR